MRVFRLVLIMIVFTSCSDSIEERMIKDYEGANASNSIGRSLSKLAFKVRKVEVKQPVTAIDSLRLINERAVEDYQSVVNDIADTKISTISPIDLKEALKAVDLFFYEEDTLSLINQLADQPLKLNKLKTLRSDLIHWQGQSKKYSNREDTVCYQFVGEFQIRGAHNNSETLTVARRYFTDSKGERIVYAETLN